MFDERSGECGRRSAADATAVGPGTLGRDDPEERFRFDDQLAEWDASVGTPEAIAVGEVDEGWQVAGISVVDGGPELAGRLDGDRLRADALVDMAEAAWASGWVGPAAASDEAPGRSSVGTAAGQARTAGERAGGLPVSRSRAQVAVTVGLGSLLGLDDAPAALAGYGPVGADVARRLALDGTWRRFLVDDDGAVVDVGRCRYRPSAALAELIRARDGTCVVPTCATPADHCDLDHTVPFGAGETSPENLGALCRRDHLAKTHAGLRVTQPGPGYFALRTPSGHVYWRTPPRAPGMPWGAPATEERGAAAGGVAVGGDAVGGDALGEVPLPPPPPF